MISYYTLLHDSVTVLDGLNERVIYRLITLHACSVGESFVELLGLSNWRTSE